MTCNNLHHNFSARCSSPRTQCIFSRGVWPSANRRKETYKLLCLVILLIITCNKTSNSTIFCSMIWSRYLKEKRIILLVTRSSMKFKMFLILVLRVWCVFRWKLGWLPKPKGKMVVAFLMLVIWQRGGFSWTLGARFLRHHWLQKQNRNLLDWLLQ